VLEARSRFDQGWGGSDDETTDEIMDELAEAQRPYVR
jgi:hypothetical protein